MHDPRPLNLGFVRDATKNEIHTAHKGGVEINALSAKHGLPVDRIKAILMLKDLEDDARAAGTVHEGLNNEFEQHATQFLKEVSGYYGVPVPNSHHRADTDAAASSSRARGPRRGRWRGGRPRGARGADDRGGGLRWRRGGRGGGAAAGGPGLRLPGPRRGYYKSSVQGGGERAADAADEAHRSWRLEPAGTHAASGWAARAEEASRGVGGGGAELIFV